MDASQNVITFNQKTYVDMSIVIGNGQTGNVYIGSYNGTKSAVKLIPNNISSTTIFSNEKKVMQKLSQIDCPYILKYYGCIQNQQGAYLFLEYCKGGSLQNLINNKISQFRVFQLFGQLLQAMSKIHSKQILYRDLKPQNILLDQQKNIRIVNFGTARSIGNTMTKGAGTPIYSAPQVLNTGSYDKKCDVWSAGLLLYEMLTGQQFFQNIRTLNKLKEAFKSMEDENWKINKLQKFDQQWTNIISRMLILNPKQRPSFQDLLKQYKQKHKLFFSRLNNNINGQDQDDFHHSDNVANILQSISPYNLTTQITLKSKKSEQSFGKMQQVQLYLKYFSLKYDQMGTLYRIFNKNNYNIIFNVYKFLLVFLSMSAYIAKMRSHIEDLNQLIITTPKEKYSLDSFTPDHRKQFKNIVQQFIDRYKATQVNKISILKDSVNKKILQTYLQRQKEKKQIMEFSNKAGNIVELIQLTNKNQFKSYDAYLSMYRKAICIDQKTSFQIPLLEKLKSDVMKTYVHIQMLGDLDQVFDDSKFTDSDYIIKQLEFINKKTMPELIEMVKKLNLQKQ